MQFAIDENNKRIIPLYSGQRAKCECCYGVLVAHCGDIRIAHWQHLNIDKDCDPWQEHETQWHRDWKSQFPSEWQEVVIEVGYERHRADVKTKFGIVVEFQNSSISSSTIKTRENFYGNMVWVINAQEFSQNFKLYSKVKNRLQYLELTTDNTFAEVEKSYENLEKSNIDDIKKIENKLLNLKWERDKSNNDFEYHNPIDEEIQKHNTLILTAWREDKYYYDYQLDRTVLQKVEELYKQKAITLFQNLKIKQDERDKIQGNLSVIEKLENIVLGSTPFKILEFEQIPKRMFEKVKAIYPETKNTFFPKTLSFNSETELQAIGYKKNKFIFAINPQQSIENYNSQLNDLKIEIETLESSILDISFSISKTIKEEFQRIRKSSKELLESIEVETENLNRDIEKCKLRIEKLKLQKQAEIKELTEEQEITIKSKRNQIMTNFKGHYHFDWKHKRPSWNVSKKTIYFDTGKDFLLEKITDEQVKKISKLDFVKQLMTDHNGS